MKKLTHAQMKKMRAIFDAIADQDERSRDRFIRDACGDDSELRAALDRMLEAHDNDQTWIDAPLQTRNATATAAPPQQWLGRRIGPYQIVRELGAGGMGTVFLASREIGRVKQEVALKVIRAGLASNEQMRRRFEQEREILASLDHPNITRLLDIGSTDDGLPYLAMDYVAGQQLGDYCDTHNLGIEDRIALFCDACEAVEYAHGKGLIHRDLKPSNMLVTSEGTLKLLDFGVAKALRHDEPITVSLTQPGAVPMTLEYASPEQIRGDKVSAPTDVYSLGVVLYELLTGVHPWRREGQPFHALVRAICDETPPVPSSVVLQAPPTGPVMDRTALLGEALRHKKAAHRRLAGDLDCIVMKAVRKQPEWRYASPRALANDLRSHLAGVRVLARRDTLRYRIERVRRRILHPADDVFHTQGMMLCTAGLLGMIFLVERHSVLLGAKTASSYGRNAVLLAVWMAWALAEARRMMRAGRFSNLDRQSWIVFTVITVVLGVVTLLANVRKVADPESLAVFWNAALAIGMIIVGLQANKVLTAGGIALFISVVAAILQPASLYLWLAGGLIAGMVLPGILLAFQSRNRGGS